MHASRNARKVGLSYNDRPPPLHKIGGDAATKPAATTKKRSRTPEKEVDISGPPINSDDDDSGDEDEPPAVTGAVEGAKSPSPSGDESDGPDRADIRPTTFQSSSNSKTSTSSNRSKAKNGPHRSGQRTYGLARSSQESKPPSSQRSRNAKEAPDDLDPVKGETMLRDPGKKFTRAPTAKPPPPRAPPPKRPRKASEEPAQPSTPVTLKVPEDFYASPEGKAKESSSLNLHWVTENTPPSKRTQRTLRLLSKSPAGPAVEMSLNMRLLDHSDDSGLESKRQRPGRMARVDRPAQSREKTTDGLKGSTLPKTESAPTATQLSLSFDGDSSLSELTSDDDFASEKKPEAECPYCKKPVDADALQRFSKGEYMTLRKQRRFCTQHKEDEARAEWKAKGYPDIDWARLDARISSHHDYLEGVLRGGRCHYGDLLARDVKAGKKRNLAKADFNNTPGYYGARGFRAMQEGIFARFSSLLRKRAVEDGLVSARGYSLYVQAVLVPELAVRLVMEDMGVGEEGARGILEESTWVGDLLCEDEGDVVDENDENLF